MNSSKKAHVAPERRGVLSLFDYVPMVPLIVATVVLVFSPPLSEPHLWQKLKMLGSIQPLQDIDIFDLALHASLPVVLLLKVLRVRGQYRLRSK